MSNEIVLSVENVSKRFSIGRRERYYRLSESLESIGRMMVGMALRPPPSDAGSAQQLSPTDSDDFWALKDVSFEVKRGEIVGIIGRNGAGKSTLLKILSRITEPTSGRVGLKGRVGSLLEVGTGFHPELTGRENIFLNGAVLGLSHWEVKKRFDEIVAFAEVEKFLDTPVKRYSSGMYMRLAFAVAAHLDTEILIVDEVLAVGDAGFQKKCLGRMRHLAAEDRTVLFVSHNIASMRHFCNTGLLLHDGKIASHGVIEEVIDAYRMISSQSSQSLPLVTPEISVLDFQITQDGIQTDDIESDRPWHVQIRYQVNMRLPDFRIGVFVISSISGVTSRSLTTDWNHGLDGALPGTYLATLEVTEFLLMNGKYDILLHASSYGICDYLDRFKISLSIECRLPMSFNERHQSETFDSHVLIRRPWTVIQTDTISR
jgi:lipopolysaccharide transport system ATP-binding protein